MGWAGNSSGASLDGLGCGPQSLCQASSEARCAQADAGRKVWNRWNVRDFALSVIMSGKIWATTVCLCFPSVPCAQGQYGTPPLTDDASARLGDYLRLFLAIRRNARRGLGPMTEPPGHCQTRLLLQPLPCRASSLCHSCPPIPLCKLFSLSSPPCSPSRSSTEDEPLEVRIPSTETKPTRAIWLGTCGPTCRCRITDHERPSVVSASRQTAVLPLCICVHPFTNNRSSACRDPPDMPGECRVRQSGLVLPKMMSMCGQLRCRACDLTLITTLDDREKMWGPRRCGDEQVTSRNRLLVYCRRACRGATHVGMR